MSLLRALRIVLIWNLAVMLIQATLAGRILGGDVLALHRHEFTAKVLVLSTVLQVVLALALRLKGGCPTWVPAASAGLLTAEILEFALGQFHNVALHVPLGVALFGGAVRQLLWALREADALPAPSRTIQSL